MDSKTQHLSTSTSCTRSLDCQGSVKTIPVNPFPNISNGARPDALCGFMTHLALPDRDNLAAWVTTIDPAQDRLSNVYPACVQPTPSDEKRRVQDAIGVFCAYIDCLLPHCTGHGASVILKIKYWF